MNIPIYLSTSLPTNLGGICKIFFIKRCDLLKKQIKILPYFGSGIAEITAPNPDVLSLFYKAEFSMEAASHTQSPQTAPEGQFWQQALNFRVHKDRADVLNTILQLQDEPLHVVFINSNGDKKLVGTDEDWAMMRIAQQTGEKIPDPNAYDFVVECRSRYMSPFLNVSESVADPDPQPSTSCCEVETRVATEQGLVPGPIGLNPNPSPYEKRFVFNRKTNGVYCVEFNLSYASEVEFYTFDSFSPIVRTTIWQGNVAAGVSSFSVIRNTVGNNSFYVRVVNMAIGDTIGVGIDCP